MKVLLDAQNARLVTSCIFKPLVQAIEAAVFLTSCALGMDPGFASSMTEQSSLEIVCDFKAALLDEFRKRAPLSRLNFFK